MRTSPPLLLLLPLSLTVCAVSQAPPVATAQAAVAAEPSPIEGLHLAWQPGTRLVQVDEADARGRDWHVVSFDDDLLTLSHRSPQHSGREEICLRVTSRGASIVGAVHVGTREPIATRKVAGQGACSADRIRFALNAEQRWEHEDVWRPWRMKVSLRAWRPIDVVHEGARVKGTRTDPATRPVATMNGEVTQCDARRLEIKCHERWQLHNGRFATPTWTWRFERDGTDRVTGEPRWRLIAGTAVKGAPSSHRSNWRGYVVLRGDRLVGAYGFDWKGMTAPEGTRELTHPLDLEIVTADSSASGN